MRGYNFGAGPSMLPESILLEAQSELLEWQDSGMSILEIGHRSVAFQNLMEETKNDLRSLLHIPSNYHILFLGTPARLHFAMIPMNLLSKNQCGGYLVSGLWSKLACEEAQKLSHSYEVASSEAVNFFRPPLPQEWQVRQNTAYLYYTPNETLLGVRFPEVPQLDKVPLIADMTSCLLTEPIDISQYGMIFAGVQKNISAAGLTLVIIRSDLFSQSIDSPIPTYLNYQTHIEHDSLYATPPLFNCYLAAKMLKWVKSQGGISALYESNCLKAKTLYQYIDQSTFYRALIDSPWRSNTNVSFALSNPALEAKFLEYAQDCRLYALKGHRLIGGMRASLYNAMPQAGVDALISFMQDFALEFAHEALPLDK